LNNDREIRIKNGITYLPVYSIMFFKKHTLKQLILE